MINVDFIFSKDFTKEFEYTDNGFVYETEKKECNCKDCKCEKNEE